MQDNIIVVAIISLVVSVIGLVFVSSYYKLKVISRADMDKQNWLQKNNPKPTTKTQDKDDLANIKDPV
jgi:hypothetical protein